MLKKALPWTADELGPWTPRARTENHFRHELYLDLNRQNLVHAVRRKILRESSASGCFSLYSLPLPLVCFFSSFEGCAAELEAEGDITVRYVDRGAGDFKIVLYFCTGIAHNFKG